MRFIFCFLFVVFSGLVWALPVGLDVKIYTDPRELTEPVPDVYIVGVSTREIPVTYFIEAVNFGTTPTGPCTLKVVLPPPDYLILPYDQFPLFPWDFELTYHQDNEYIFVTRNLQPGARRTFAIDIKINASLLPPPMTPINCVTLQASAFLRSRDERESYSDNTSFCLTSDTTLQVDLWIRKSIVDSNCVTGIITYRLEYGNSGSIMCNDVSIWDILPFGVSFLSSNPPAVVSGDRLEWDIPSLPAGGSGEIELTISISNLPRPIYFINVASIRSPASEVSLDNNQAVLTSFCPETSVVCYDIQTEVLLFGRSSRLNPGDVVMLRFTIRNSGSIRAENILCRFSTIPDGLIDVPPDFAIFSLDPGQDTSIYITDTLASDCIPNLSVIRFVGRAFARGSGVDCDSSNNISSYAVLYECPSVECPRPATASTRVLTPNNDGYNDFVSFYPRGNVVVKIFTESGVLVRTLVGDPVWDGLDSDGKRLEPGLYIWQMFCPSGSASPFYTGTIVIKK